jgi:hypothetical protein
VQKFRVGKPSNAWPDGRHCTYKARHDVTMRRLGIVVTPNWKVQSRIEIKWLAACTSSESIYHPIHTDRCSQGNCRNAVVPTQRP